MSPSHLNSTQRFSNRVENYVRYRPSYPAEVLSVLRAETGLDRADAIADIGSGTGISAKLFLDNHNVVFGVEPNAEMRRAAEGFLHSYPQFHSVAGTAEATTLLDGSVNYAIAAQAFHWFNPQQAHSEFIRILKPGGWLVLLWNSRRLDSTQFLCDYEALLQHYGTDYKEIRHNNTIDHLLNLERPNHPFEQRSFYNEQLFDFESLKGRLLSSSYVPASDDANFEQMIEALQEIFDRENTAGHVRFEYDTKVYFAQYA